jgi:hypothetical protein
MATKMMAGFLTVSEAAREIDALPRHISDMFYRRKLTDRHGVMVGGRWLLYRERLGEIKDVLAENGRLPA